MEGSYGIDNPICAVVGDYRTLFKQEIGDFFGNMITAKTISLTCPIDESDLSWNSAYKLFNCEKSYHQVKVHIVKKTAHVMIESSGP